MKLTKTQLGKALKLLAELNQQADIERNKQAMKKELSALALLLRTES